MHRRDFLTTSIGSSAAVVLASTALGTTAQQDAEKPSVPNRQFQLRYAPHLGMFSKHGGDATGQIDFMSAEGFTAFEDNSMRHRGRAEQDAIAKALDRNNMLMGVLVANDGGFGPPLITSGNKDIEDRFCANVQETIEVAKRLNGKYATVVCGTIDPQLDPDKQQANVVRALKRASALCEPHGLILCCEPLNWRDHPNQYLRYTPHSYEVMKQVDSPSCKILFDIYHQQASEGNLIEHMDQCWDEIAYIQVGDNPGRREPGTGEINYRNVFKFLAEKGYTGPVGMEHGNAKPGKEGERAVIDAYVLADNFSVAK
ncbi:MAG: TIM barrel protein [Phycisphaerales bacterium]|nr:TIM barrel protein [Phycisphaerales bacterium]